MFRRHVQSAVNEGRLTLPELQINEAPFSVHTIDFNNAKVLIRPEQAEGAKGKNVIIGESRPKNVDDTILAREVTLEKTLDGRESLKITVKASRPGGQESSSRNMSQPVAQARPVRPASSTGQTGQAQSRPRIVKPKAPEVRTCKLNESRVRERVT